MRQGNLNPEIEEKLLTLQRYQEKQAKGEPFDPSTFVSTYSTRGTGSTRQTTAGSGYDSTIDSDEYDDENSNQSFKGSTKKRGAGPEDDDDEWVLDTPRKYIKKADREKMERKKEPNYMADVKKQITDDKAPKIIVKTSETGKIPKNIIVINRSDVHSSGQKNLSVLSSSGESEKSPEKALLASKLKLKAAQKIGMTEEQIKHHKLQVIR